MFRTKLPTLTLCLFTAATVNAQTLKSPPESRGELLYSVNCGGCHATNVHWREKKLVTSWGRLKAEVNRWKVNGGLDWTEDDVIEVAHYLDAAFYRFPSRTEGSSAAEATTTSDSTQTSPKPLSHAGIAHVSGGVGIEERATLQAIAKDYNLKIVFTLRGSGEYLTDIKVSITDRKQTKIFASNSVGPWLLAKLPAGQYQIHAAMDGKQLNRSIALGNRGSLILHMYWP